MKTTIIKLSCLPVILIFLSCGGGGVDVPEEPKIIPPVATVLASPIKDEVCLTGTSVSNTQSEVAFVWQASENTDSYNVVVKNLKTQQINTYSAVQETTAITLTKGDPYAWYVVSKSNSTAETAQSELWKFYLAGDGIVSYAPFPADVVFPAMGSSVAATNNKIELNWKGTDADNDISGYEVFMGTVSPPTASVGSIQDEVFEVTVSATTVYYWQVKTTDDSGNSSTSEIFQFKVN